MQNINGSWISVLRANQVGTGTGSRGMEDLTETKKKRRVVLLQDRSGHVWTTRWPFRVRKREGKYSTGADHACSERNTLQGRSLQTHTQRSRIEASLARRWASVAPALHHPGRICLVEGRLEVTLWSCGVGSKEH